MSTISWNGTVSGDWSTAADWNTGTVPGAGDDVRIGGKTTVGVTITTPEAAHSLAIVTANASVTDSSTLTIGTTFALNAGKFTLAAGGVLQGGTLEINAGKFIAAGGTLSGDTVAGTLVIGSQAKITLTNGVNLVGSGGTGPGLVKLTGANTTFAVVGPMTLNNATINIGSAYSYASLKISDPANAGGGVTLGSSLQIVQTGTYARIGSTYSAAGNILVNQGTILAGFNGGQFNIYGSDKFVNQGSISVTNGDTMHIGNAMSNAGTITVAGGTLTFDDLISNTGLIRETGGAINLNGSLATTSFGVVTRTGGSLNIGTTGTLSLGTSTFAVGTGSSVGQIGLLGTIIGGTIADGGNGLALGGGTLSGVVYEGTLNLSVGGSSVNVTNGIVLEGPLGSGPGTVNLTGDNSYLILRSPTTLNNATINIGGAGSYAHLVMYNDSGTGGVTLLGPQLNIVQTGKFASIGDLLRYPTDSLVNQGTISASVTGGAFTIYGSESFFNQGTIIDGAGDRLHIASNFNNSGTIVVAGGTLVLDHLVANTGTISETSGAIVLGGAVQAALLDSIARTGGSITIETSGVVRNSGSVLSVGSATALGIVTLYGTVIGGTIVDSGSGIVFDNSMLSGVVYDGTLDLSAAGSAVRISNGIALAGAGGTGQGAINLTGNNSYLGLRSPMTFNNAVVAIGGTAYEATIKLNNTSGVGGATTFGSNLTLVQTGSLAQIEILQNFSADALVNNGTIEATATGGHFNIVGTPAFTNGGEIVVGNGDILGINTGTFTNTGTIAASSAGIVNIYGTGTFTNSGLITIGAGDTLNVGTAAFANTGTIDINAGAAVITPLVQGSGIVNIGTGGLLDLTGAGVIAGTFTGAGTLELAGSPMVSLTSSASVSVSTVLDLVNIQTANGVTLTNLSGGTWTMSSAAGTVQALGSGGTVGSGTFSNFGSFVTTGGATDNASVAFINYRNVYATSGTLNFLAALTNSGTLTVDSGATLSSKTVIRGSGQLDINGTGVLLLNNGADPQQVVSFIGSGGDLVLQKPLGFNGTITGFGGQDSIDLINTVFTSESVASGNRLIGQYNGSTVAVLKFTGTYVLSNFNIGTDGHGGTLIKHS